MSVPPRNPFRPDHAPAESPSDKHTHGPSEEEESVQLFARSAAAAGEEAELVRLSDWMTASLIATLITFLIFIWLASATSGATNWIWMWLALSGLAIAKIGFLVIIARLAKRLGRNAVAWTLLAVCVPPITSLIVCGKLRELVTDRIG